MHTCSLDHKNALNNYIARGMKIYKKETIGDVLELLTNGVNCKQNKEGKLKTEEGKLTNEECKLKTHVNFDAPGRRILKPAGA